MNSSQLMPDSGVVGEHFGKAVEATQNIPTSLYFGGEWHEASSAKKMPVYDPCSGREIATVASASPQVALAALAAADEVSSTWARQPSSMRLGVLARAAQEIRTQEMRFAHLISAEMGKALPDSLNEVRYAAGFLEWFAQHSLLASGRFFEAPAGGTQIAVTQRPVGVCLAVTPWNFPLAMATRKIGPALAAGCPIMVKPAQSTPLTMLLLAQIFHDVGLPAGVLSVLPTNDNAAVVSALLADSRLAKLSFTGSTAVGQDLAVQAARRLLRISLELGGNAPFVVCADADVDAAVAGAVVAKLRNGGQACTAANRFIVHEAVSVEFTKKLAKACAELPIGPGLVDGVALGPMVSVAHAETIREKVTVAVADGATVFSGGVEQGAEHAFVAPTVLTDVPAAAAVLAEETFGPIAPIVVVSSDVEAIEIAHQTEYGLAAYVYTENIRRAHRFAHDLEVGMIGLNTGLVSNPAAPFGGIKQSGFGREGGHEGIAEYVSTQYVASSV